MKHPFELVLVALLLLAATLTSCAPAWQLCEVDLFDHPSKPAPAARATVKCQRDTLCDSAVKAGGTVNCDGKPLVEVGK